MSSYSGHWTAGLEPAEKKNFEDYLGNSQKLLDKLHEICYNMVLEAESGNSDYTNPNWAYKTADSVGYRRALKNIMTLCKPATNREGQRTNA